MKSAQEDCHTTSYSAQGNAIQLNKHLEMVTGMPKTEVDFKIKYEWYCVFSGVYLANKEVHIV